MKEKILVTDGVHPILLEGLEAAGYVYSYLPKISLEEVQSLIEPYVGLIINSKIIVDKELVDKAKNLRFVARLGSGREIVDEAYVKEKGIAAHFSPEGNCNAVAEHALGMLLALLINLQKGDASVRNRIWDREACRGEELKGKKIAIIGFGHTGSAFAEKLSGMSVEILTYDKYKKGYADTLEHVFETDMQHIYAEADIVSFHLPLSQETKGLFTKEYANRFQKKLILLNTSRGAVVKTSDLIELLENGKIRGACLDVFENEKPASFTKEEVEQYEQLYAMKQVLLSPHVAGWTKESKKKLAEVLLSKILKSEGVRNL